MWLRPVFLHGRPHQTGLRAETDDTLLETTQFNVERISAVIAYSTLCSKSDSGAIGESSTDKAFIVLDSCCHDRQQHLDLAGSRTGLLCGSTNLPDKRCGSALHTGDLGCSRSSACKLNNRLSIRNGVSPYPIGITGIAGWDDVIGGVIPAVSVDMIGNQSRWSRSRRLGLGEPGHKAIAPMAAVFSGSDLVIQNETVYGHYTLPISQRMANRSTTKIGTHTYQYSMVG
jgi:hypothetical protein